MSTRTLTKTAKARQYDAVYDKEYYVSSDADHAKSIYNARHASNQLKTVPDAQNMFSELGHHPRATVRFQEKDPLPMQMTQRVDNQATLRRNEANNDFKNAEPRGRDFYKYAYQPMSAGFSHTPMQLPSSSSMHDEANRWRFDDDSEQEASALAFPRDLPPGTMVTASTQTDYRESETQTDPYTPEYTVRPGSAPEVLSLATLSFGYGLPAGLAEVEMIERARERRAWEKTLPDPNDASKAIERAKMMEAQELKEWKHREEEIQRVQDERLQILQDLVVEMQEKKQANQDEKLEKVYQQKMASEGRVKIRREREGVMRLRKLAKQRQEIEGGVNRREIVTEYANPASDTFAPRTRTGLAAATDARKKGPIRPVHLESLEGILDLEASLPRSVTTPRVRTNARHKKPNRGRARLNQTLKQLDETFQMKKTGTFNILPPIRSIEKVEKPKERPPTPEVMDIPADEQKRIKAITRLQAILRGRAVQNSMYEGKESRKDLINELRSTHALSQAQKEIKAREEREAIEKRQVQAFDERRQRMMNWVVTDVQAEHVGKTLDTLSKELVRLQEERRIHAFAILAERERRMREAVEAGLRQEEEDRRKKNDEVFKQVMQVHRATVDSYLEDIILACTDQVADAQARDQVREQVHKINEVADEAQTQTHAMQSAEAEAEKISAELVSTFLLGDVEKVTQRAHVRSQQRRFLHAAHQSVLGSASAVEKSRKQLGSASQRASVALVETATQADDNAAHATLDDSTPPLENNAGQGNDNDEAAEPQSLSEQNPEPSEQEEAPDGHSVELQPSEEEAAD